MREMRLSAQKSERINYAVQYNNKGHNYGLILLKNKKHGRIEETCGEDFANMVLKTMGKG